MVCNGILHSISTSVVLPASSQSAPLFIVASMFPDLAILNNNITFEYLLTSRSRIISGMDCSRRNIGSSGRNLVYIRSRSEVILGIVGVGGV